MKRILSIILLLSPNILLAQTTILDSINFYGSFRAHIAAFDDRVQVENNSSRIGLYLDRRIAGGVSGYGKLELGTNLVRNNTSFNPDAASAPDESFFTQTSDPVTTRLGFIGVRLWNYGSLSIGKQWGVYYDVTSWTDNFWVFGGKASGTYNTNTDGGTEGTGRAENAIQYRYEAKKFSIGLQTQLNGDKQNYAASAVVKLSDQLSFGAAYNNYAPTQELLNLVGNEKTNASSITGGVIYTNEKIYAALVYDYNESESQFPGDTVVAFPANGIEALVHYYIVPKLRLEAGVNYLKPTSTPEIISPDFNIFQIVIGGAYYFLPDFLAYTEFKLDEGTDTGGNTPSNVFAIELRYNFSFGASQVRF